MTRLTKSQLEELVYLLAIETGINFRTGYWNGLVHIYNKDNGAGLVTGTTRECYNYIEAFLHGYRLSTRGEF